MTGQDDEKDPGLHDRRDLAPPAHDPSAANPPILSYDSTRRANLKTLRRLPVFEANLAAAKLEAAGIPAFVDDMNVSGAHAAFGQARLQVDEWDLERAEACLAAARATTPAEGDYVEEAYRCPACHRKAVDLLPPSAGERRTRLGCLAVLLVPVVVFGLANVFGMDRSALAFHPALNWLWVLMLAVLCFKVLGASRRKRCRECGHEW